MRNECVDEVDEADDSAGEGITAAGLSLAVAVLTAARRSGNADEGRSMWNALDRTELEEALIGLVVCFDYLAELALPGAAEETLTDMRALASARGQLRAATGPETTAQK